MQKNTCSCPNLVYRPMKWERNDVQYLELFNFCYGSFYVCTYWAMLWLFVSSSFNNWLGPERNKEMFSFTFSRRAASDIGQKSTFFEKKGRQKLPYPLFNPFWSILHQNKALHNFYKRGQRRITGRIKVLDYVLAI